MHERGVCAHLPRGPGEVARRPADAELTGRFGGTHPVRRSGRAATGAAPGARRSSTSSCTACARSIRASRVSRRSASNTQLLETACNALSRLDELGGERAVLERSGCRWARRRGTSRPRPQPTRRVRKGALRRRGAPSGPARRDREHTGKRRLLRGPCPRCGTDRGRTEIRMADRARERWIRDSRVAHALGPRPGGRPALPEAAALCVADELAYSASCFPWSRFRCRSAGRFSRTRSA